MPVVAYQKYSGVLCGCLSFFHAVWTWIKILHKKYIILDFALVMKDRDYKVIIKGHETELK
jgi:hypothetical protein